MERYVVEIVGDELRMLGGRQSGDFADEGRKPEGTARSTTFKSAGPQPAHAELEDDMIPF